jgi:hypothetical protein
MFEKIRDKMREKIRKLDFVMTVHAEEEMENDGLSIFDIEGGILSGEIVERQKDTETGEWKYLIGGKTLDDDDIMIVAKIGPTEKLVIITLYLENYEIEN